MCNNRERYEKEKEKRFWLAKEYEQPAIESLSKYLNNRFRKCNIKPIRYDDIWFEKYDPETIKWVRGCSDYCLDITKEDRHIYIYTEVKIKNTSFDATINGGIRRDQYISKYGCCSYYLDIYVCNHMNKFCDKADIPKNSFIIMFTDTNFNSIRLISLEEVNNLVENGWNGNIISTFGANYGSRSYLIPIDATHNIEDISGKHIKHYSSNNFSTPKINIVSKNS